VRAAYVGGAAGVNQHGEAAATHEFRHLRSYRKQSRDFAENTEQAIASLDCSIMSTLFTNNNKLSQTRKKALCFMHAYMCVPDGLAVVKVLQVGQQTPVAPLRY